MIHDSERRREGTHGNERERNMAVGVWREREKTGKESCLSMLITKQDTKSVIFF